MDVVQLISHLEVYKRSKPAIQALRLCHRYGDQAPIARLSTELIDMIINELLLLDYEKARLAWGQKAACLENRCTVESHLDPEDIHRIFGEVLERRVRHHRATCPSSCKKTCFTYPKISDHDVREHAAQDRKYHESHVDGVRAWTATVNKNLIKRKIRKVCYLRPKTITLCARS